jgi:hypothetical protein
MPFRTKVEGEQQLVSFFRPLWSVGGLVLERSQVMTGLADFDS